MKNKIIIILTIFLAAVFIVPPSFSQELPKPGTVINKSNFKQYSYLFPPEFAQGFENGWDGLFSSVTVRVSATKPAPLPPRFVALSQKNKGKYNLDKDGVVAGGWDYNGFPFPDPSKTDKDFSTKLMWNYGYRYFGDQSLQMSTIFSRRKGETVQGWETGGCETRDIRFINRIFDDPKPLYKTPNGLKSATQYVFFSPGTQGMLRLEYEFINPRTMDETYMYIPTLRRTTRSDASARSTPQAGSMEAVDDFSGFNGKTNMFNYEIIKEQKVLAIATGASMNTAAGVKAKKENVLFFPSDNWEVRDVYVIVIKSKDPKYPQGKKIVYMDKENYNIYYSFAMDRAGKLWKSFVCGYTPLKLADGSNFFARVNQASIDSQDGMGGFTFLTYKQLNGLGYKYNQFRETELIKIGK